MLFSDVVSFQANCLAPWTPGLYWIVYFAVYSFCESCTSIGAVNRGLAEPVLFVQYQPPPTGDEDGDSNDNDESTAW